jgi:hypothetical protein
VRCGSRWPDGSWPGQGLPPTAGGEAIFEPCRILPRGQQAGSGAVTSRRSNGEPGRRCRRADRSGRSPGLAPPWPPTRARGAPCRGRRRLPPRLPWPRAPIWPGRCRSAEPVPPTAASPRRPPAPIAPSVGRARARSLWLLAGSVTIRPTSARHPAAAARRTRSAGTRPACSTRTATPAPPSRRRRESGARHRRSPGPGGQSD